MFSVASKRVNFFPEGFQITLSTSNREITIYSSFSYTNCSYYIIRGFPDSFQHFGHLMGRTDSLEKTLMLGKTEGRRRRGWWRWGGWMALLTQWTWIEQAKGVVMIRKPGVLQSMGSQRFGHDWVTELNWTGSLAGKESGCNAGDPSSIPGLGRSTGEGMDYPL